MKTTPTLLAALLLGTLAQGALTPAPNNDGLILPPGFKAVVVAEKLKPLRNIVVAPNGDVYANTPKDDLVALRDTNGDGKADEIKTFGQGGGTGIALRGDWLYASTTKEIFRYKIAGGELVPSGKPERIVKDLPNQGQHSAKAFAFGADGKLYVEVGSPSNAYGGKKDRALGAKGEDPTEFLRTYGGYWRYDADKPDQTPADAYHFSTGHRHSTTIALNPATGKLYVAIHGRDQLNTVAPQFYTDDDNAENPSEVFHELTDGANFGWPFTYWDPNTKQRKMNPEYGGDGKKLAEAGKYPDPLVAFPAHWAPMQLAFYTGKQFPDKYQGGAFLAFHGSWNRAPRPQKGFRVAFIPFGKNGQPTGDYETFADNFAGKTEIASPGDAAHRPNGVAVGPDGSLYISDSQAGSLWRIIYTGDAK